MRLESKKLLLDMLRAADTVTAFVAEKSYAEYETDALLRSGVERQITIVWEALAQLAKRDPETAGKITAYRRIIGLRNLLVHGYADVDSAIIWELAGTAVPRLRKELASLLSA
jgi:uncharacterized protein with HEPN domain